MVVKAARPETVVSLQKAQLERLEKERAAEAVERDCAAGHALEDIDLIDARAFPSKRYGRAHNRPGGVDELSRVDRALLVALNLRGR